MNASTDPRSNALDGESTPLVSSPTGEPWQRVLSRPRRLASGVARGDIPSQPGVYAWFRDGQCVYVGKASDLRFRLSTHLGTSLDLSRSTLRSWVAVRELGLSRAHTRQRPTVMTAEQVAVVNAWMRGCDLAWESTATREGAAALEAELLAAWRPPINVA